MTLNSEHRIKNCSVTEPVEVTTAFDKLRHRLLKAQGSLLIAKKIAPLGATDNRQVWSTQCGMPVKINSK